MRASGAATSKAASKGAQAGARSQSQGQVPSMAALSRASASQPGPVRASTHIPANLALARSSQPCSTSGANAAGGGGAAAGAGVSQKREASAPSPGNAPASGSARCAVMALSAMHHGQGPSSAPAGPAAASGPSPSAAATVPAISASSSLQPAMRKLNLATVGLGSGGPDALLTPTSSHSCTTSPVAGGSGQACSSTSSSQLNLPHQARPSAGGHSTAGPKKAWGSGPGKEGPMPKPVSPAPHHTPAHHAVGLRQDSTSRHRSDDIFEVAMQGHITKSALQEQSLHRQQHEGEEYDGHEGIGVVGRGGGRSFGNFTSIISRAREAATHGYTATLDIMMRQGQVAKGERTLLERAAGGRGALWVGLAACSAWTGLLCLPALLMRVFLHMQLPLVPVQSESTVPNGVQTPTPASR